jgi:Ser/Thr protein kinase RdoA (MazF antagonist)
MKTKQTQNICKHYDLGILLADSIAQISGGLLHKIWRIETTKGKYAVKELNQFVLDYYYTPKNYILTEIIARSMLEMGIPANVALLPPGDDSTPLFKSDNSYYMVFDWVEGQILTPSKITKQHAEIIGKLLARMHSLPKSITAFTLPHFLEHYGPSDKSDPHANQDWQSLISSIAPANPLFAGKLKKQLQSFLSLEEATQKLTFNECFVISHRDLFIKNVSWLGLSPTIFDWELTCPVHPMKDLFAVAYNWSTQVPNKIDYDIFDAIVDGYKQIAEVSEEFIITPLTIIPGRLHWLKFNLQRSLLNIIPTDDEGKKTAALEEANFEFDRLCYFPTAIQELHSHLHKALRPPQAQPDPEADRATEADAGPSMYNHS